MTESLKKRKKRRNRKINNALVVLILLTMIGVIVAFGINVYNVLKAGDGGQGETVEVEVAENKLKNSLYSIGNNPTDINKTYFEELTAALEPSGEDNSAAIASAVAKSFVTEYYTWINKDGNYDIGGMQYIYGPKQSDFEKYTLYNFYVDMDLYLTQVGRENLMQVSEVIVNGVNQGEDFVSEDQTVVLPCYDLDVSWSYAEGSGMDVSQLQNHALFRIANNNGRFEIVGIN